MRSQSTSSARPMMCCRWSMVRCIPRCIVWSEKGGLFQGGRRPRNGIVSSSITGSNRPGENSLFAKNRSGNGLGSHFGRLRKQRDSEQELNRELQSHLQLESEEQQESGLAPEDARYAAQRAFGNAALIAEDVRAICNSGRWERFWRDVRYGARSLRRNPGFTVVAVLTLALGIGANTAIFSAIDALMLRPLPFTDSDQLVRIYSTKYGIPITGTGYPGGPSALDVRDFAQSSHSFQKMLFYDVWSKNVSFGASGVQPEQMRVGL